MCAACWSRCAYWQPWCPSICRTGDGWTGCWLHYPYTLSTVNKVQSYKEVLAYHAVPQAGSACIFLTLDEMSSVTLTNVARDTIAAHPTGGAHVQNENGQLLRPHPPSARFQKLFVCTVLSRGHASDRDQIGAFDMLVKDIHGYHFAPSAWHCTATKLLDPWVGFFPSFWSLFSIFIFFPFPCTVLYVAFSAFLLAIERSPTVLFGVIPLVPFSRKSLATPYVPQKGVAACRLAFRNITFSHISRCIASRARTRHTQHTHTYADPHRLSLSVSPALPRITVQLTSVASPRSNATPLIKTLAA